MKRDVIQHPKAIVLEVLDKLREQIEAADPYGQNPIISNILALIDEARRDPFVPGKFWTAEIRRRAIAQSTGFVPHQLVDCPHCKNAPQTCPLCHGSRKVFADTYLRYTIDPEFALANPQPIPPSETGRPAQQCVEPKIIRI